MKLKIQLQHPNAKVPTYAHGTDACFDLFAATVDNKTTIGQILSHGSPVVCGTGLAVEVPEGWAMLIFSRSGHGFKTNTRLANCVGVIDSGYTGEVLVKLAMDDEFCDPEKELFVRPGDRIAQACLVPAPRMEFEVVDELPTSARGAGGLVVAKNCTVLREALTEIKNRIEDHPMYAPLTMEEECKVGGDTAELSYLVRVADEALKETA